MAALCLIAVFLPSFLLVVGTLPFWQVLRRHATVQSAMRGVNAAVVGLLPARPYAPVRTGADHRPGRFAPPAPRVPRRRPPDPSAAGLEDRRTAKVFAGANGDAAAGNPA